MMTQQEASRFEELRARRYWTEEDGRFVVETWEASGESVLAFAQRVGIQRQRVVWWRDRLQRTDEAKAASGPATATTATFVPMTLRDEAEVTQASWMLAAEPVKVATTGAAPAAVAVVVIPGVRIEVTQLDPASAVWVAALVNALREVSP